MKTPANQAITDFPERPQASPPATGLDALVLSWEDLAKRLRQEQEAWNFRGWNGGGPSHDAKLKAEMLERCISELKASNAPDERPPEQPKDKERYAE